MKRFIISLLAVLSASFAFGQHILTYQNYAKGVAEQDTTTIQVVENAKCLKIKNVENPPPISFLVMRKAALMWIMPMIPFTPSWTTATESSTVPIH